VELIGLYLVATWLLIVAGIAKASRPDDTARALSDLVPVRARGLITQRRLRAAIRGGAILEVALGLAAMAFPRPVTAGLVAMSYALFGGVVLYARARGGALSSCGCFGRTDTPATTLHVVIDLVLAGACLAVALSTPSGGGSLVGLLRHQPLAGVPLVFVSAVGLYMVYVVLAVLPALEGARRPLQFLSGPSSRGHKP
jgi:hypothetical protein